WAVAVYVNNDEACSMEASNTNLREGAYLEAMLQLEKEKRELERTFSTLLR
ncbi:hypothetical protein Tco_1460435, partial [Tanacetum coccineum]